MNIFLYMCLLVFIFFQGCGQPPSRNQDEFKNDVNSNSTVNSNLPLGVNPSVNSTTSMAQPDAQPDAQPTVTLVNKAF